MRTTAEITELLNELESRPAFDLEDQDLDFKEWNFRSISDAMNMVVEMTTCMANGGGGTVVLGVHDRRIGRSNAILGVPPEVDINRLKKSVYDSTDPHLTPVFEEIRLPEGTGRLLVMQVHGGLPPYTDTSGRGKIRVGKDCQPLTGTLRRRVMVETGETDFTAVPVPGSPEDHISPSAMEKLRTAAERDKAPADLLRLPDLDLLDSIGLVNKGQLTRTAIYIAGKESSIKTHLPGYAWTHLRMRTDIDYIDRTDGVDALFIALERLNDRIMAHNLITTVQYGMFHFEYRTYPEVALREALLNAFCHTDFRLQSPILVKQYPDRLEIGNAGGFIGGITPDNILHHQPVPRNPCLVDALVKLRLVNRSNLGVSRMFEYMLIEGKKPPVIHESGESVCVTFAHQEMTPAFRAFISEEAQRGRILNVDHLLILRHLLEHPEIDTTTAAHLCQRDEGHIRDILNQMETRFNYLERGGTGRGTYWCINTTLHQTLAAPGRERDRRIDWEAAKTRILSILKQHWERREPGLSNAQIRQIARLDRAQVKRLMSELRTEGVVNPPGRGRNAAWSYREPGEK
jgi:ATP-dependent DNA helicase RecG